MTRRYFTTAVLQELQAKLSKQDFAILKSVSDLRFMSGNQLTRMHYGPDASSARATRRALLRLTDLECLTRLPRVVGGVRAGSAGFVYSLGLAGQRIAMEQEWQPKRRGRRPRSPGILFLAHCLLVAELHTRLVEADRDRRLELIELAAEPLCHRVYAGLGSQRVLKPDSFLRFGLGEYEYVFFIEVDRATHGSGAIARKLREYVSYEATDIEAKERGVFPKVLLLVPDEARSEVISGEIEQLAPAHRELFAVTRFECVMEEITQAEVTRT